MNDLHDLGKAVLVSGILIAAVGLVLIFGDKIPYLGKLPGDIFVRKKGLTFYFPVVTSIILSLILTLILYLISKK